MFFWFILILITTVVIMLLVSVFSKAMNLSTHNQKDNAESDIEVYKSQLFEINDEEANGQISVENAKEARLELARRILASEKQVNSEKTQQYQHMQPVLFISILVIIAGSFGLYSLLGNPDLPTQPFESLMNKDDTKLNIAEKIVKSEALLARNPDNTSLLDSLGDLYLEAGRFRDAANIFNRSLGVNGETASRFLGYGIALMGLENGVVNKDAENAFREAARLEPENPQPQIFLARGLIQNGEQQQAISLLENFTRDHGKGQAWAKDMQQVIDQLQGVGPEHKAQLTPEQHALIVNNVGKLEERLQENSQDLQGWLMLINAYFLLEQPEKVQATYDNALKLLSPENKVKLIDILKKKGFSPSQIKEAQ